MKRLNLKKILAIVCYSLALVTLYNCNEDSIIENPQESKMLVEDIDFDNFYKKKEFKDFYKKVVDNKKTLRRGAQNIGINTSLIKHIKTKELETYTFSVEKKNLTPNQFENLVITKNLSSNEISAAFLKYDMSTELLLDPNGKPYPFQGTLEVVPVDQENIESLLSRSTTLCFRVGVLMCNDNRGEYTSDHQVTEACTKPENIYTAQSIECATTFGPPNFTDETDGGGSVPVDSGSSGGSSTNPTSGGSSLVTALIPPTLKDEWFEMTDKLTDQQQRFLYKLENSDIRKKLGEFFENNNFSKEAEKLVIEIIETLTNGGDVDLDDIIINKLQGKAKCVYDKLLNSSNGFKEMIQKFDGEFPVSHLKFTINNNIGSDTYGITIPPKNYVIEIQINENILSNLSDLGVATTLAHELVHAEIFRKMLSAAKRGDLNTTSMTQQEAENYVNSLKDNFPGLYDYYVKRWHPSWNHNAMASHYRTIIADIIQSFDNNRLSRSTYESIAWAGLGKIENNQSTIAWQNLNSTQQQAITNILTQHFFNGTSNCN